MMIFYCRFNFDCRFEKLVAEISCRMTIPQQGPQKMVMNSQIFCLNELFDVKYFGDEILVTNSKFW